MDGRKREEEEMVFEEGLEGYGNVDSVGVGNKYFKFVLRFS